MCYSNSFMNKEIGETFIQHQEFAWLRQDKATLSTLPALCEGNPSVIVGFASQSPVKRSFDVLSVNQDAQTLMWRHCNAVYHSTIGLCLTGSFITMTSQWARWRLKSPASRYFTQQFIQAQIKKTSEFRDTGLPFDYVIILSREVVSSNTGKTPINLDSSRSSLDNPLDMLTHKHQDPVAKVFLSNFSFSLKLLQYSQLGTLCCPP